MKALALVLTFYALAATQAAQTKKAQPAPINFNEIKAAQERARDSEKQVERFPDPRFQAAQQEYAMNSMRHRAKTFDWQLTSSKIIFWMVLGLVITGVAFSAIQFGVGLQRKVEFSDAEVALSVEGIKVRSQFLGVVTLALSLGFFYLYLKTVYPISEVKSEPPQITTR